MTSRFVAQLFRVENLGLRISRQMTSGHLVEALASTYVGLGLSPDQFCPWAELP